MVPKASRLAPSLPAQSGRKRGYMMCAEKDKMLAGEPYDASPPKILADLETMHRWLASYNSSPGMSASERRTLLLERLAAVGEGAMTGRISTVTTDSTSASARAPS
jgi:hypothetical protein